MNIYLNFYPQFSLLCNKQKTHGNPNNSNQQRQRKIDRT